ncbi:MAG: DUF6789 family protein [Puniceicoccaceae bacterium]
MQVAGLIVCGIFTGFIGAVTMNIFLRWVSSSFKEPVNMIKAIGSYATGSEKNAIFSGTLFHLLSGAFFGIIYTGIFFKMGAAVLPQSLFIGVGFGFAHGLLVSYGLMLVSMENHPIRQYRNATFSIGLLYLIAHVIYGAVMGLSIGLVSVLFG